MDVLTTNEMLAREEEAFHSGITAAALMDAAGEAMAAIIRAEYPHADSYLVLVGKGNNGGDGLVVARQLLATGKPVRVVLAAPEKKLGDLPRAQLDRRNAAFPNLEISDWRPGLIFPGSNGVVVDAMLGLQARGALRGEIAEIVVALNAARETNFFRTVALDLPTGLAALENPIEKPGRDAAIVADVTITVGFAKEILCRETSAGWVGRLDVVPWSRARFEKASRQVLIPQELASLLPRRSSTAFKGDFGHLAIVAGSAGFNGAPVLCVQAAQAIGAGLLSVITKPDITAVVGAQAPAEAMVSSWPTGGNIPPVVEKASAIVFGPGLAADEETTRMLRAVLAVGCPVLIDADGITMLAKNLDLLRGAKGPVVLTPHPGEMARLVGRKFGPDEREAVARAFVDRHDVTLVLKGTRTLITAAGAAYYFNTTGNPGLSTGGSGDTLSGIIGGLLVQKVKPLDAARLGVWLHGHAADLVLSDRDCEEGITPTMLSKNLGRALVSLRRHAVPSPGLIEIARPPD